MKVGNVIPSPLSRRHQGDSLAPVYGSRFKILVTRALRRANVLFITEQWFRQRWHWRRWKVSRLRAKALSSFLIHTI
jgi:hypothetical protein